MVIEIKRLVASTESLIDQITRYMGWVKENLAKNARKVRGIIVVAKLDQRLKYSVRAIPNLEVKCFNISLADAK